MVEASSSNLFWIGDGFVGTPPLNSGILAGVTRLVVLEICRTLGLPVREVGISPAELLRARGIFLSLSSWGIIEVASLDGHAVARSPWTAQIRAAYEELIQSQRR